MLSSHPTNPHAFSHVQGGVTLGRAQGEPEALVRLLGVPNNTN